MNSLISEGVDKNDGGHVRSEMSFMRALKAKIYNLSWMVLSRLKKNKDIGIGISTYNRPEAFLSCMNSVAKYAPRGAFLFVADDGSTSDYTMEFECAAKNGFRVFRGAHGNVARNKNRLLKAMMNAGCEHLFLIEDDMKIMHEGAFRDYIKGSKKMG